MTWGISMFGVVAAVIVFVLVRIVMHAHGYIKDTYSEDWWV